MSIKVANCYIYPLKSGSALSVDQFKITKRGPENDRLWMLIQGQGTNIAKFISQRDKGCEKLALVRSLPMELGAIKFSTPDGLSFVVQEKDLSFRKNIVQVLNDQCDSLDAGNEAARWFSDYLQLPCRLVKLSENFIRFTNIDYSQQGDQVSFADGFPLLITNLASLEKLNTHFPSNSEIGMARFRPNIILTGAQPFEEDIIHEIKIGDVTLEFVKPCTRCMITTIDQRNGISLSDEPLRTLGKVRQGNAGGLNGVFFGQNAIPRKLGIIKVGDEIEILSKKPLHPALKNTVYHFEE